MRTYGWIVAGLAVLGLSACESMQSHQSTLGASTKMVARGDVNAAIADLDQRTSDKKALLYNLERGELLFVAKDYKHSVDSLLVADTVVTTWEQTAKSDPQRLMSQVGAALISERLKPYDGQDYEKVMLTTRLAMDRVAMGDIDNARVDIKRTHEREAIIQEFRSKETAKAEEEARSNGVTSSFKEIDGYPVETLNDPEVLALKNGYQNAFSHYLAGFLYEALNEPSLAAPGYRKAIELRPGQASLETALKGLDRRASSYGRKRKTDVLFVIESGAAPPREARQFTLPVPSRNGIIAVSVTYAVIQPSNRSAHVQELVLGSDRLQVDTITDFNVMARRSLKDEMPGVIARAAVRAVVKGVAQDQVNRRFGVIGNIIGSAAAATTEGADDRMWRNLPERISIARAEIAPGDYVFKLSPGDPGRSVTVAGQYMVVPVRLFADTVYLGDAKSFGPTIATAALPPEPAPAAKKSDPASPAASPAKKAVKKKPQKAADDPKAQ